MVRSVSTADPAFPDALLMPYGVAVLPEQDRIVSTNSSMHDPDLLSGVTYQVWRLSDLKLLKTAYFDPGAGHYAHIAPEEPRVAADGSVYVQTLGCGIERITGLTTNTGREAGAYVSGQLVRRSHDRGQFPDSIGAGDPWFDCAGYLQPREAQGSFATLVERQVLRALDGVGREDEALVTTGSENRMFLVKLDTKTGALSVDEHSRMTTASPDSTWRIGNGRMAGRAPASRTEWCFRASAQPP